MRAPTSRPRCEVEKFSSHGSNNGASIMRSMMLAHLEEGSNVLWR